jgi:hypothetical protein
MGMSFFNLALARTPGIVSVYGIVSHFGAIYLCCIIQVWAKGKVKKRHPHAYRIVSFIYNPGAPFDLEALDRLMSERKRRGHLLKSEKGI